MAVRSLLMYRKNLATLISESVRLSSLSLSFPLVLVLQIES